MRSRFKPISKQQKMNLQNHFSIFDWETYHLINDTQSKFIKRMKLEIERANEKKKGLKKLK